jgi:hypothetical protein
MGLLNGILGNASEVTVDSVQSEFAPLLIEGETIQKAFKLIRDKIIFTNKRMIIMDKQGITGSKVDYQSIPYKSIVRFSKESAGLLDLDAELKIWVSGTHEPIKKEFSKNANINEVYKVLSEAILK